MKDNNGITLIALVITIIVMLILVGVTIRISSTGNLFKHAAKAAAETKKAIETENSILDGKITIGDTTYNSIDEYVKIVTLVPHYGDANLDGTVNTADLTAIYDCIDYLNGGGAGDINEDNIDQIKLNSDINLDGQVTVEDRNILAEYLLGHIESIPYTGELP